MKRDFVMCNFIKACDYGVFFRITADALFRYLSKCCSDIIDIVPLKRYTVF